MASGQWTRYLLLWLVVVVVVVHSVDVDVCNVSQPDPCLPGGKWDAILGGCRGHQLPGCFSCYTGPHCNTLEGTSCTLLGSAGNPVMFAEYWETSVDAHKAGHPCASTPSDYELAYQDEEFTPLQHSILDLHRLVQNAVVDQHTNVVVTLGATQALGVGLKVLAQRVYDATKEDPVAFSRPPHYGGYQLLAAETTYRRMDGTLGVLRWDAAANASRASTIEIVTHPNNPDGSQRQPEVTDPYRVLWDCAYLWPHFTDHYAQRISAPIVIFSGSKHTGHAGSRVGWALVRDPDIAAKMRAHVMISTLGPSIDPQMRYLSIARTVLALGLVPTGFYATERQVMDRRWARLVDIFAQRPPQSHGYRLVNGDPGVGAYAWVQCPPGYSCQALFGRVNLTVYSGVGFESTDDFTRIGLISRTVEMQQILSRINATLHLDLPSPDDPRYRCRTTPLDLYTVARSLP